MISSTWVVYRPKIGWKEGSAGELLPLLLGVLLYSLTNITSIPIILESLEARFYVLKLQSSLTLNCCCETTDHEIVEFQDVIFLGKLHY